MLGLGTKNCLKSKGKLLVVLPFAYLLACSTEPSKKAADDSVNFEIGENDATTNAKGITGKLSSRDAFALTVHPIVKKYCGSCHASTTSPLFASENRDASYDDLSQFKKVNFDDPESSRLVQRLRSDSHNCWSDCEQNANEMKKAIEEWIRISSKETQEADASVGIVFSEANNSNSCTNSGDLIFIEAEDATLTGGYQAQTEGDITFISSGAAANNDANAAGQPMMEFKFNVKSSGLYTIHANVAVANNGGEDSFFIKVNSVGNFDVWNVPQNNSVFTWSRVFNGNAQQMISFFLKSGENIVQIRHREPNIKIDSIVLTSDPEFDEYSPSQKVMCFDISQDIGISSGAFFGFTISEFGDGTSYIVSKPVLISPQDGIVLKDIDILVNGSFVPQYNAYKAVDGTFNSGKTTLSEATIIMTVDKSYAKDRFSVRFGTLELAK